MQNQVLDPESGNLPASLCILPQVIDEQTVYPFCFYKDDGIESGMRYGNDLYGLICEYSIRERLAAYSHACELASQAVNEVVITVSKDRYAIWVSMQSPEMVRKRQAAKATHP